jgi:hypothetical protein
VHPTGVVASIVDSALLQTLFQLVADLFSQFNVIPEDVVSLTLCLRTEDSILPLETGGRQHNIVTSRERSS